MDGPALEDNVLGGGVGGMYVGVVDGVTEGPA